MKPCRQAILAFLGCAMAAAGGQLTVGQTRGVVTEWSEPEVRSDRDGSMTIIPSHPKTIERRRFGASFGATVESGHATANPRPDRLALPAKYDIRLKGGRVVTVRAKELFTISGRRYMLVERGMDIYVRSLASGREKRLRPQQVVQVE